MDEGDEEVAARAAPGRAAEARAALATRGLDEHELDEAGFKIGPDGALHAPVRDERGGHVAVRRYAGVAAGARPLSDLDAPAFSDPRLPDPRFGRLEWRGVFAVAHHVARPPSHASPAWPDVGALLVDDEFGAELAARRLGLPAVAPSDPGLISEAALLAAHLAGPRRTLVAFARAPERDVDQVRGIRFAQCAAAIEVAGGRAALAALPPRGSLEQELRRGRRPALAPLDARRVRLDRWTRAPVIALGRAAWSWRRVLSRLLQQRAVRLARRGGPVPLDGSAPTARLRENLAAAAELQRLARTDGIELLLHGGLAVDLIAGRPLREHKDADMLMLSGGPAEAARLIRAAEGRGFETWLDLPGGYFSLRRGLALLDVWQSRPADGGRWIFARNVQARLTPPFADGVERALDGVVLRTLHPHYLLCLKERQLREVQTWFPRWSLTGARSLVDDVAALRAALATSGDDFEPSRMDRARGEVLSLACDPGPVTLSQGREFVAVHLLRRRVR